MSTTNRGHTFPCFADIPLYWCGFNVEESQNWTQQSTSTHRASILVITKAWNCPCYFCILRHWRAAKCGNNTEKSKHSITWMPMWHMAGSRRQVCGDVSQGLMIHPWDALTSLAPLSLTKILFIKLHTCAIYYGLILIKYPTPECWAMLGHYISWYPNSSVWPLDGHSTHKHSMRCLTDLSHPVIVDPQSQWA